METQILIWLQSLYNIECKKVDVMSAKSKRDLPIENDDDFIKRQAELKEASILQGRIEMIIETINQYNNLFLKNKTSQKNLN